MQQMNFILFPRRACYFGKRDQCESFVNKFLLPRSNLGDACCVLGVGQCLIKYVTGPAWRACDELT